MLFLCLLLGALISAAAREPSRHEPAQRMVQRQAMAVSSPSVTSSLSSSRVGVGASSSRATSIMPITHGTLSSLQAINTTLPSDSAAMTTETLIFSLSSENPTAVPLSSIRAGVPSAPTHPLSTTWAAGSQPTALPNAPPIPDAASLVVSDYPALDVIPPTDSDEVQNWIKEVQNSGVDIPQISPMSPGGCANNSAAASDPSVCWWTCGGCTRDTDVVACPDKLTWGLTYDDGPSLYTPDLLQYLDEQNLKTTFFVVGSRVISSPRILQAEYMESHHIAIHTWSHPPLTQLTNEQVIAELGWTKKVIYDTLGVTPNMMRPPFGDIDDRVRAISMAMGLVPVMWTRISTMSTFDTNDFDIHGGTTTVSQVLNTWGSIMGNATTMDTGFIVLEHDLFQQTVEVATGYILPNALAHDPAFNIEPVITCLDNPLSNAYIQLSDNTTSPGSGFRRKQESSSAESRPNLHWFGLCSMIFILVL